MNINAVYNELCLNLTHIELNQRMANKITKSELLRINDHQESAQKSSVSEDLVNSFDAMSFKDATSGETQIYGKSIRNFDELKKSVHLHKNKQYQWFLAEAYEQYEVFTKKLYACLGGIDRDIWPLEDYGKRSKVQVDSCTWSDFYEMANAKRDTPTSILNVLRSRYPTFLEKESQNALKINLKFAVTLVEMMRHIIVHSGGVVGDKSKFADRVFRKSGIAETNEMKSFISFFWKGNDRLITLVERPSDIPFMYRNIYSMLIGFLLAHAHLLMQEVGQP